MHPETTILLSYLENQAFPGFLHLWLLYAPLGLHGLCWRMCLGIPGAIMSLFWAGHLPALNWVTFFVCAYLLGGFLPVMWLAFCMGLVPAWGTTRVQSSSRGVGCQMSPHSCCHHTWATFGALVLAVFQAKIDGVERINVTFNSYWLISRFALLFCPAFPPSPSPSPVFCQIICFFFSVLIAHCLVFLLLHPPQSKIFFYLGSDLPE